MITNAGYGTHHWYVGPTDPSRAPYLAAEVTTYACRWARAARAGANTTRGVEESRESDTRRATTEKAAQAATEEAAKENRGRPDHASIRGRDTNRRCRPDPGAVHRPARPAG